MAGDPEIIVDAPELPDVRNDPVPEPIIAALVEDADEQQRLAREGMASSPPIDDE